MQVKNPILPGFNPDPSMIFVDGIYYIATSTFEWFPGVQIHKSVDLVNWELANRPLNKVSFIDLKGNPKSSGVWAPCLTYNNGLFYLVYSDVKTWANDPFKDVSNYVTNCTSIEGEWSDPVYIDSIGFDASFFHDEDGKKYYVSIEWDYRESGTACFSGIFVQEWDDSSKKLVGESKLIFKGTDRGLVEGPHIYKRGDYYYLLSAEGGTDIHHAESVCRSKNIFGPYELHPNKLLITSFETNAYLQKAGHGSLCKNDKDIWYFAHLCGRFVNNTNRCPLGRETSIQEIVWVDDWPYLKNMTSTPSDTFYVEGDIAIKSKKELRYHFNNEDFLADFQTLRIPYSDDQFSISEKPGYLTIYGKQSIYSIHTQSILARRQTDFKFVAETTIDFDPEVFQHTAGLIHRYDEDNQYYLYITFDERINSKVVKTMSVDNKQLTHSDDFIKLDGRTDVVLGVKVDHGIGQFYVTTDKLQNIGKPYDATILSDEYASPMGFTGAFIGMIAQDLKAHKKAAHFKNFTYIKY